MRFLAVTFVLLLLLYPLTTHASLITVRSDGTGNHLLLRGAVAASMPGDSIEVGPGVYPDSLVTAVTHSLTIYSTDGAATTVLVGGGSARVMFVTGTGVVLDLAGLTFRGGAAPASVGGGLTITEDAVASVRECVFDANANGGMAVARRSVVTIERCEFTNNTGVTGTGGLYVAGPHPAPPGVTTVVDVIDCEFRDNNAGGSGGGVSVVTGADVDIVDCEFWNNTGLLRAGAISAADSTTVDIDGCLFVGNTAHTGSAIYHLRASGSVTNCTFDNNNTYTDGVYTAIYGTLLLQGSDDVVVERNIFANENGGYGLFILYSTVIRDCNIYWGNDQGNIAYGYLEATELEVDPLFCDPASGDYTVLNASSAAPAQSLCGQLIGAFPVGCGPVPTAIAAFKAWPASGAVTLEWKVFSDEDIRRYELWRNEGDRPAHLADVPSDVYAYTDRSVEPGREYVYTLIVRTAKKEFSSFPVTVTAGSYVTALGQNQPNPFNPVTRIPYSLAQPGRVRVDIYDVAGRLVRTVVDRDEEAGRRVVNWDGLDGRGERAASGVYFCRLTTGSYTNTRKMILMR